MGEPHTQSPQSSGQEVRLLKSGYLLTCCFSKGLGTSPLLDFGEAYSLPCPGVRLKGFPVPGARAAQGVCRAGTTVLSMTWAQTRQ